jgi:hypothetical protein
VDPVVQLKEQELQIRAANDQMDNQIDQAAFADRATESGRDGASQ